VYAVVIKFVMRIPLVKPARLAGVGIAREHTACPFVVARTQLRIPRSRIRRAVEDQVLFRIVCDPSPDCAAADRSEERRVGKECRSRWSREQQKKQTIVG